MQKSLFVENCTTDNRQHNIFLKNTFGWWVGLVCLIFFVLVNVSTVVFRMTDNASADLRSSEKEAYFRSWDFAHHQIYKSIFDAQKLIKKT